MHTRGEKGFVLPLTIFVLTVITIMLAAIFVQVQVDRRVAESSGDVLTASSVAASGLGRYFAYRDSLGVRPPDGDSVRVNVVGGYADVVAYISQRPADSLGGITYIVRSTGTLIRPTQGSDPQARRAVAQFGRWQFGTMDVLGAFTAINDFRPCTTGGCAGTYALSGWDECTAISRPGLRVPTGSTPNPIGPPQVVPFKLEADNAATVALQTEIDWASVKGGVFDPDYTTLTDLSSWSSYLLVGDQSVTDLTGTGLLVVTGDLTTSGLVFNWRGVVLVGGTIVFLADTSYVRGAVVSGLNVLTGPPPSAGLVALDSTHVDVRYNSCHVASSFAAFTGFAIIANSWMDNWAMY